MYNETAILKMTQSLNAMAKNPLVVFKDEILCHFKNRSSALMQRLEVWLEMSTWKDNLVPNINHSSSIAQGSDTLDSTPTNEFVAPHFPLLPGSKGFCISLKKAIAAFKDTVEKIN